MHERPVRHVNVRMPSPEEARHAELIAEIRSHGGDWIKGQAGAFAAGLATGVMAMLLQVGAN